MPRVKKVDEVAALSGQLLELLGARRTLGPGAYPPTLGQLAELCGVPAEDGRVLKAVAKKAFTEKATAKAAGKVSLGSPVYFKGDVPDPVVELAGRMLRVLESQRDLGGNAYPPTLGRLAELCGKRASDSLVSKAAGHELMAAEVTFAKGGKPTSDCPVILNRDIQGRGEEWNSSLLAFAFGRSRVERESRGKGPTLAFTPRQLAKNLHMSLQGPFVDTLKARARRKDLPPEYAWLANKEPLIFLASDLQPDPRSLPVPSHSSEAPRPVPPAPARDFAGAFREAFDRLDRDDGLTNNVKLVDLRRELADFPRERFDAGLRQLRVDREFSLDSHEGLLRPLTAEEREAGIAEAGSLLVYASRR